MNSRSIQPVKKLSGVITVPGDKSITHRAFILSSIAQGNSTITGALEAEDCMHTKQIMQSLGVSIEQTKPTDYTVKGVGLHGLTQSKTVLDVGNSGTGIRLLAGLLAAQKFSSTITGDESIQLRPMKRVIDPLILMGAHIDSNDGKAPLTIHPSKGLKGITYEMPVSSAQVKSCLMLAGLYAEGQTVIRDPGQSRDHTERMFSLLSIPFDHKANMITEKKCNGFTARDIVIPGDFSSAAFFIAAALIHPKAKITIKNVGTNPTRSTLLSILADMGGNMQRPSVHADFGVEPQENITIKSSQLKGTELSGNIISTLIDEIPIFAVIASQASTPSIIKDAQELRVKESDRIKTTVQELSKFGIDIKETEDGMIINPSPNLHGAEVDSHGDHRIAMSCAIAATIAKGQTVIHNTDCVNTSFPDFWKLLESLC